MLDSVRRQTHKKTSDTPKIVRETAHSRSYRLQRITSSITTGTTTDSSVTAEAFIRRIKTVEMARKAPRPAVDQPITRFFRSAFQRTLRTAPTAKTAAPTPARTQR